MLPLYFKSDNEKNTTIGDIYKNLDYYMDFLPDWRIKKIEQMKLAKLKFAKFLLSLSLSIGLKYLTNLDRRRHLREVNKG